ncbi:MAG TPA: DNA glycosylase [Opitutaceae bacterium]|nr:DNA glycosylase [Opitutaceae bacterium]
MPSFLIWTDWKPLALPAPPAPAVVAEVLDGGQAFRWTRTPDGVWQGVWSDCVARLKPAGSEGLLWSAPQALADAVAAKLPLYFASAVDFAALADGLPWRSDPHLARCLAAYPGLRLLRQPLGESLLCFLCSATKQIVQIRQMVELLAQRHGREIVSGILRLPTWAELAAVSEDDLRASLLGFRARYVKQTAQFLAGRTGWLETVEKLPYAEAKQRLRELPGVGEKVADCVLLFGAGRLEAFPVDVWILKAMERRYGLEGWTPQQTARLGRVHFGPNAGLAQQYLFAWERAQAGKSRPAP